MARRNVGIPGEILRPLHISNVVDDNASREHTQLLRAIYDNDYEKVSDLVTVQGVKPHCGGHRSAVWLAAMEGRSQILTLLLDNGGEPDHPEINDHMWLRRPIHMSACNGHIDCIDVLLNKGVDVNSRDNDHRTALHWASSYGQNETVLFLIDRGASVNSAQLDGFTALHAATCLGHTEVCRILIQHGADVNLADRDNWSALHTAACYGYIDVARIMLEAGASIHQRTSDGETSFHIACSSGYTGIAEMFYNHGAQINAVNINGYTPFHLAVYYNKLDVAHFLITVNADMDTANNAGQTPLYLAALRGEERILRLMVEAGCKLNGQTALPFSARLNQNHADIVQQIQYLTVNPRSLRELCCFKIRSLLRHTLRDDVLALPIPTFLKDLILFRHLCRRST
ncbi:uncharacterized protein LOC143280491 [Babylonia areolata]|uniref:uncharacterized protein LOC143280491 n=1 Tax=Babylonia areolata TaxID=304850 RepID=UPI003FD46C7C